MVEEYSYRSDGNVHIAINYVPSPEGNVLHSENGPSYKEWYMNGRLKRVEYHKYGKLHRDKDPAVQEWCEDGYPTKWYYYHEGKLDNTKGPAVVIRERPYSDREVYIVNNIVVQKEWFTHIGKNIERDFRDDTIRNMVLNIFQ